MSTSAKVWIAIAVVLIIAGIACFIGVTANKNWQKEAFGGDLKTETIDVTQDFLSIDIKTHIEDISFIPSGDGKCRVEFTVDEKETPAAVVREGVLEISIEDEREWYEFASFSFEPHTIKVYLPKAEYASLTIESSTGDAVIPKEFGFERIKISASTGDVDCFASASGSISVETDTGHIKLEDSSAAEISLSVSTGRLELTSVKCAGEINIKVSTGRTVLNDVECGSLVTDGSTGDVDMKNVIASGKIYVERSTGDVKFELCDAAELEIETNTGDVTGSLRTEKVFSVNSDTGSINVPSTMSGGMCRVNTDTGDIKITIG